MKDMKHPDLAVMRPEFPSKLNNKGVENNKRSRK